MIGSGFYLPWWAEWLLLAVVYAPFWIPAVIAVVAARWLLRRRRRS